MSALLLFAACSASPGDTPGQRGTGTGELVVFAAASLSGVFPIIGHAFESAHPNVRVRFNFDGSQRLRTQLEFGARAHVFASADETQMLLARQSQVLASEPAPFATNSLVVVVPAKKAGREASVNKLQDLARDGVKLAIAQREVPAGRYARIALRNLATERPSFGPGFEERVLRNVVSEEANVRAVAQKVSLDEVDAGIVYATDIAGEEVSSSVRVIPIPRDANVIAVYPVATIIGSGHARTASEFVELLLSEQGQLILRKHGFGSPTAASRTVRAGLEG